MKLARVQLADWLDAATALLFPDNCQICLAHRASRREGYVCTVCRETVQPVEPPFCDRCGLPFEGAITSQFECANCKEMNLHFEFARAAVVTRGAAVEAIHAFKYRQALWLEPFLGDLLLSLLGPAHLADPVDAIVPVPLHPLRRRERGYNQAERLARYAAHRLGVPIIANAVRRVTDTPTQTRLDRQQRSANVRGAFQPARGAGRLAGRAVALVDDVLTTGATTSACAGALLKAGAKSVRVFTVARAIGGVA